MRWCVAILTTIACTFLTGTACAGPVQDLIDSARPGAVVVVPPGHHLERLRIDKALTLDGQNRATIDGGGENIVIEITAPGVTIRNLRITGSGATVSGEPCAIRALAGPVVIEHNTIDDCLFGIDLRESPGAIVRNNTIVGKDLESARRGDAIRLWWCHDSTVEGNTVRRARDLVFWYSEGLTVRNNRVEDSRYGLHFMYSHRTVLSGNDLRRNAVGIYLMYSNEITLDRNTMIANRGASGYGIGLKDCDNIIVRNNAVLANRVGVYIDNSPSSVDATGLLEGNTIADNEIGILATPNTHDNVFTRNALIENEEQAAAHGRGTLHLNAFSRDGVGNFWSDYPAFDGDGDGLGDLPYEPRSLFHSLLSAEPNLRIFIHSPAQQAIEFTARVLPELRPEPVLRDPAPLVDPPSMPAGPRDARRAPMLALGSGLLVLAGGLGGLLMRGQIDPLTDRRSAR